MTDIDISPESVEQLAHHDDIGGDALRFAPTLRALSAALTKAQAETAAAFDRAAVAMGTYHWNRYASKEDGGTLSSPAVFTSHTHQHVERAIRALATIDQSSALAAIEAAAEARGMRKAVEIVNTDIQKVQPEMTRRAQRLAAAKAPGFQYAIHRADLDARISCRDKILAAIPQDKCNDT